jgi:hypothetical protein
MIIGDEASLIDFGFSLLETDCSDTTKFAGALSFAPDEVLEILATG